MVAIPMRLRLAWVTGPAPQRSPTGRGAKNARSSPTGTSNTPAPPDGPVGVGSGLANLEPILAKNLTAATPTAQLMPSSLPTCLRIRWPISTGGRWAPDTSKNASSTERGSTSGVNDRRIFMMRPLTSEYSAWSPGKNTMSGHSRRARVAGMAE